MKEKFRVYVAGKLQTESERELLEKIDEICRKNGFETFLPHRDVGLALGLEDVDKVFRGDIIDGFKGCNLIIAVLDGLHVGAGTAWELGYAYAKNIPRIGIKTDETVGEALDYLSAILVGSMKIVISLEELEREIKKLIKRPQ
jgi:nucleoside 2-deoxyribosyltransferase